MTNTESLFPPKSAAHPTIYAYSETRAELAGLLKVGYTDRAVETRMAEHYPTKLPDGTMPYRVELVESAMRPDGSCFLDHDVHRLLKAHGFPCAGGEWFRCGIDDVRAAMRALESIKGFRSLNKDIATIISNAKELKKAKAEDAKPTKAEAKALTEKEKEMKSKRREIQEKLIKFATRVPIFMYLSDYRERSLKDVVSQLESGLFRAVTGLNVQDFELLVGLNVFNGPLMNDAVFKFKRYEDGSISYTGIDPHAGDASVGGWDTAMDRATFDALYRGQQASMAPTHAFI